MAKPLRASVYLSNPKLTFIVTPVESIRLFATDGGQFIPSSVNSREFWRKLRLGRQCHSQYRNSQYRLTPIRQRSSVADAMSLIL
jgi:hypothetical protein